MRWKFDFHVSPREVIASWSLHDGWKEETAPVFFVSAVAHFYININDETNLQPVEFTLEKMTVENLSSAK